MNDYIYNIDKQLEYFLQKEIIFKLNDQTIKRGRLIIFSHGYFTFLFNIKNFKKNKNELLKIPVPFDSKFTENQIIFDYRIKTLFNNNKTIENNFKQIKKSNVSKFYDKILTIGVHNEI